MFACTAHEPTDDVNEGSSHDAAAFANPRTSVTDGAPASTSQRVRRANVFSTQNHTRSPVFGALAMRAAHDFSKRLEARRGARPRYAGCKNIAPGARVAFGRARVVRVW